MEPSANTSAKRMRKGNFTEVETNVLVGGIEDGAAVLFAKFSSSIDFAKKTKIWRDILERVNACGECERTVTEIKKKWQDLKKVTKSMEAKRRQVRATGGGPPPPDIPAINQRIIRLIPDIIIEGIVGGVDSDCGLTAEEDVEKEQAEQGGIPVEPCDQSCSSDLHALSEADVITPSAVIMPSSTIPSEVKRKKPQTAARFEERLLRIEEEKLKVHKEIAASLKELVAVFDRVFYKPQQVFPRAQMP